jgi:predicted ATPase
MSVLTRRRDTWEPGFGRVLAITDSSYHHVVKRANTCLPVRRVQAARDAEVDGSCWPGSIPAVRQLLEGVDFGPLTILVGENGSGKSTVMEAIALAFGLSAEGGSTGARHRTRQTESGLWEALTLRRDIGASRWGFFLRAETMHGFYTYLEQNPSGRAPEPRFHEMSHGESFLELLASRRFVGPGLYLLDEPESALSFTSNLALAGQLHEIASQRDAQAIVSTHSPILAAVPGASLLELGPWGLREADYDDLQLVRDWRGFLDGPGRYLRHLIQDH